MLVFPFHLSQRCAYYPKTKPLIASICNEVTSFEMCKTPYWFSIPRPIITLKLSMMQIRTAKAPLELLQLLRTKNLFNSSLGWSTNPFVRPPSTVMEMGVEQAISWWDDIQRFGEGTSNKLKMVLVGLAEAGKTTIVRNLTGKPIPSKLDRTAGIEITEGWKPVDGYPLEISIWDFAGQADYFASHQIFLTKGSLFLLVVDLHALFLDATGKARNDGDPHGRVYRWLEMLHLRVPGAAVALVGTHCDAEDFKDPAKLDEAVELLEQRERSLKITAINACFMPIVPQMFVIHLHIPICAVYDIRPDTEIRRSTNTKHYVRKETSRTNTNKWHAWWPID